MGFLIRLMTDRMVEKRYINAGAEVADAVPIYLANPTCFYDLKQGLYYFLDRWIELEAEYIRRGYKTIGIEDIIEIGSWDNPAGRFLGQKRSPGEEPVYHARDYRQYLIEIYPLLQD